MGHMVGAVAPPGRNSLWHAVCYLAGWGALYLAVREHLGVAEGALCLGAIAFAESLSGLCLSGFAVIRSRAVLLRFIEHLLLRWVLIVAVLLALASAGGLAFFDDHTLALLVTLGIALLSALLRLCLHIADVPGAPAFLIRNRLILLSLAIWGLGRLTALDGTLIIAAQGLALIVLMACIWRMLPPMNRSSSMEALAGLPQRSFLELGPILLRQADFWAVLLLFPLQVSWPYLLTRALLCVVMEAGDQFQVSTADGLFASGTGQSKTAFLQATARVNIAFLLVGGGLALAVLAFASSPMGLGLDRIDRPVLNWLLLGALAGPLFGASATFLDLLALRRLRASLGWGGGVLILLSPLALGAEAPLTVAKTFAIVQLGHAAICALVLARVHGIWPGLTALLIGRIRLF